MKQSRLVVFSLACFAAGALTQAGFAQVRKAGLSR